MRDGSGYNGELILDMRGNSESHDMTIVSSGNSLHIEFMSTESVPAHPDLFTISYNILGMSLQIVFSLKQVTQLLIRLGPISNISWRPEEVFMNSEAWNLYIRKE